MLLTFDKKNKNLLPLKIMLVLEPGNSLPILLNAFDEPLTDTETLAIASLFIV